MECIQKPASKQGKVKMKVIPWHCQQRYQSSISQISLNHTLTSAENTRKIKTLLYNNKCLAKALELCKCELARKENAENIDVISFAGIKLKDLSVNLKKMTISVDETLALLQSCSSKHDKKFIYAPAIRRDLKQRMRVLSGIEKLEEVVESLDKETYSTSKQNLKNNKESKKISANKIKEKNVPPTSFKQKSIKRCLKKISGKLPKNVSQRDSSPQDDSQPSYLLGLSSDLDTFKNKIEGQVKVGYKDPGKKKLPKSKNDNKQLTLTQHSKNVIEKNQQKNGSCKRTKTTKSIIIKKTTEDSSKAGLFVPHKRAKTLQDDSITSQSSDGGTSVSSGKSCENFESQTSSSPETIKDKIASGLQYANEISNLNGAFNDIQPIEGDSVTCNMHTSGIYKDLESEILLHQPRVVLKKSNLPKSLKKKQSFLSNEIGEECHLLSKKCAPSETSSSTVAKKHVQFLFDNDDDIEILSPDPKTFKKPIIKKLQKRPLKENSQNMASVPKKRAMKTFGNALQSGDLMSKNTFIVTAEVHKPPDGFILEKTLDHRNLDFLNMQPTVVLTDIFKFNLQNTVLGCTSQSQIVLKEPATTEMVKKNETSLYTEDTSNNHGENNKENKIGGQNFWEERKQSRRVSSKVTSYKEMNLNVKLRRC